MMYSIQRQTSTRRAEAMDEEACMWSSELRPWAIATRADSVTDIGWLVVEPAETASSIRRADDWE